MDFSNLIWTYNQSFNYKGTHVFQVNCTSDYGNITLRENFVIRNTKPEISLTPGGYINLDTNIFNDDYLLCYEDTICTYNFSANVTENDFNDVLTFSNRSANTTLSGFSMNSSTGIVTINITTDFGTGEKTPDLQVSDSENTQSTGVLLLNVTPINDAPTFSNLQNQTINMTQLFSQIIYVSDEENNTPYNLSVSFLSCATAEWSDRNSLDCELFNESQYLVNQTGGTINITFTPTKNDVGSYILNFTVIDSGNATPLNASTSQIVNYTVNNLNLPPAITYLCDNSREGEENSSFACFINATDTDETSYLNFSSNFSWFLSGNSSTVNSTTDFKGSALINFTPTDFQVGNWSVNITVTDSSGASNSSVVMFYISNLNDSLIMGSIPDITAYTSNTAEYLFLNVTDDDLLISGKTVYNETIYFISNDSEVTISPYSRSANLTTARIFFNPSIMSAGNHSINITVHDANNFSSNSTIFVIQIVGNSAPTWDIQTNFTLTEDVNFYFNLSENVTDSPEDTLVFSYYNLSSFPSFSLNSTTGIINFTPTDSDIGEIFVRINVTDGATPTEIRLNFTIQNVNDNLKILTPFQAINATVNATNSNINTTEDTPVQIFFFLEDDDTRIPTSQRKFYNETFSKNISIQGPNSSILSFDSGVFISANRTKFTSTFTPGKTEVGEYEISVNITDLSGSSYVFNFNLTIEEVQHSPELSEISNSSFYKIGDNFYLEFNATDSEDKNKSYSGSNLTFAISNLSAGGDFLEINLSSGIINLTLNQSHAGVWSFNVTVNDTTNRKDNQVFNITVYDFPIVTSPSPDSIFYLTENETSYLNFSINHSVQDNLTYTLYLRDEQRNQTTQIGNGSEFLWPFTPNFTDETTCSPSLNLTLNFSNQMLLNTSSWQIIINHTNSPINFSGQIGDSDQLVTGGASATVVLSDYFSDIDASDKCHNQTVGFIVSSLNSSGAAISVSITNWTNGSLPNVTFSASETGEANYTITAFEYNSSMDQIRNVTSNNFTVQLAVTTQQQPTQTSSSGGGGSSSVSEGSKLISLKIIVPGPISAKKKDKVIIPIQLSNDGEIDLNEIILSSYISKNGLLRRDLISSFDKSYIQKLPIGSEENLTMIVDINTEEGGLYEVTINATVRNPEYKDWAKVFINIEEDENIQERIIFTEEFIIGNPECAEIFELVEQAKDFYQSGDINKTRETLDLAIDSCRRAIAQPPASRIYERVSESIFTYVALGSLGAFVLGFLYYSYRRVSLRKKMRLNREYVKEFR